MHTHRNIPVDLSALANCSAFAPRARKEENNAQKHTYSCIHVYILLDLAMFGIVQTLELITPIVLPQEIAKDILEQQTPKQVYIVRGKLYELLVNCLPPEIVFQKLSQELIAKLDDQLKYACAAAAATYEHRMQVGCPSCICLPRCQQQRLAGCESCNVPAGEISIPKKRDGNEGPCAIIVLPCGFPDGPDIWVSSAPEYVGCTRWLIRLKTNLLFVAGRIQGNLSPGGFCCKIHERIQILPDFCNGLKKTTAAGFQSEIKLAMTASQQRVRG